MSSIAGIDFDSGGIYVVTVDEDTGAFDTLGRYPLEVSNGVLDSSFNRARLVRGRMPPPGRWEDAGVVAIGIEDPYSRFPAAIKAEARIQGAILACLPNLPIYPLKPQTANGWKALVGLKTNAAKTQIAAWAKLEGAPPAIRQDFYDAFCIARAARELHDRQARIGRAADAILRGAT